MAPLIRHRITVIYHESIRGVTLLTPVTQRLKGHKSCAQIRKDKQMWKIIEQNKCAAPDCEHIAEFTTQTCPHCVALP